MSTGGDLPSIEGPGAAALSRARRIETIEAAYAAWDELRREEAAAAAAWSAERARLEERSRFVLGSLRAASESGGTAPDDPSADPSTDALALGNELSRMVEQAEAELSARRAELERRVAAESEALRRTGAALRAEVCARVSRYAERSRPRVKLWVRPAGQAFRIVHLDRLSSDDGVLLLHLLTGKVPSRYAFLEDEATDDPRLGPPSLYPEEGLSDADTRPTPTELRARLEASGEVLPARGFLPISVAAPEGRRWFRFLRRGPVLELERFVDSEQAFDPRVPSEVAERVAGVLLRLKLRGGIDLEIETDVGG